MRLIQPVDPQQAEGELKAAFNFFNATIGTIPAPMAMFSVSTGMFKLQMQLLNYFTTHPTLSFTLLCTIRYVVSKNCNYQFCTHFNMGWLEKQGMTKEEIEKIEQDPERAPLDDKDRAMLVFVAKAVKSPESVVKADMDRLHIMGWADQDILDAMVHAGTMISGSVLMKTFKLDRAC